MYSGKYKKKRFNPKFLVVLSLLLCMMVTVGGTLAWLTTGTESVVNTFEPSFVDCQVTEGFDGTVKSNVNVTNTGDIDAFIRVKLVTYRVNKDDDRIGGTATIEDFVPGDGWFEKDGFYYYDTRVAPGQKPATDLISSITLTGSYDDVDGGKQVIEVMAEAIQADGKANDGRPAVTIAWGVTVNPDGTISA